MENLNICPCCSTPLLHHLGNNREYWFCRHCWAEMPNPEILKQTKHQASLKIINLSTSFSRFRKPILVS